MHKSFRQRKRQDSIKICFDTESLVLYLLKRIPEVTLRDHQVLVVKDVQGLAGT